MSPPETGEPQAAPAEEEPAAWAGESPEHSLAESHSASFREADQASQELAGGRWLSSCLAQPLPADVPLAQLVANGLLLARVGAALLTAAASGQAARPADCSLDELLCEQGAATPRAAQRALENATQFCTSAAALGVHPRQLCSPADVTNPGPRSARALTTALHALAARASLLGLGVAPWPAGGTPSLSTQAASALVGRYERRSASVARGEEEEWPSCADSVASSTPLGAHRAAQPAPAATTAEAAASSSPSWPLP
jgi:hypothetical protein